MAPNNPVPIRFTDEDLVVLEDLKKRTGLTVPGVLRLAIRTLRDRLDEQPTPKQKAKLKK